MAGFLPAGNLGHFLAPCWNFGEFFTKFLFCTLARKFPGEKSRFFWDFFAIFAKLHLLTDSKPVKFAGRKPQETHLEPYYVRAKLFQGLDLAVPIKKDQKWSFLADSGSKTTRGNSRTKAQKGTLTPEAYPVLGRLRQKIEKCDFLAEKSASGRFCGSGKGLRGKGGFRKNRAFSGKISDFSPSGKSVQVEPIWRDLALFTSF